MKVTVVKFEGTYGWDNDLWELAVWHTLIGVIDSENLPSIELHRKCGYEYAGTVREAGRKFGRWLSIVYYQKIL